MTVQHIEQPWGNPGSYSQAVRGGGLIAVAGQLGADPGGPPVAFGEQARIALTRLVACVEAAGGLLGGILKINAYLHTLDDFPAYDAVYREIIAVEPKPARTTVEIVRFPEPLLVEVDCWAVAG